MSEWKEYTLENLCENISYGYTESASSEPIGPKFLRITDIVPARINWANVPYCKITDNNHEKYKLEIGDIVIARTGATTGYNKTIKDDVDSVFASYLIRYKIDKRKADPFYIGFVLQSNSWYDYVDAIAGGSAQPGANAKQLGSFVISLPPLPEQRAIASILTSLDDKIDLLHRQNATLEKMAETLFRQWFVEEAKEEWDTVTLSNIAVFFNGKERPREKGVIPIYGGNGILGYTNESNYTGKSIIIGRVGAYCGSLYYEDKNIWVSDNALLVKAKEGNSIYFLLYLLKTLDLNSMAEGSSHPLLTQTLLKSIEVQKPPFSKNKEFDAFLEKMQKKIESNHQQIRTLTQLRDTLLPKLMNGEVQVDFVKNDE
jgi:type I restriction enzyme S subunit